MKTRPLTEEEKAELLRVHANELTPTLKESLFFLAASLVLSLPFAALFLLTARIGHDKPWPESLAIGGYGMLVGPGALLIICLMVWLRPKPFSEIRKEINEGICHIKVYRLSSGLLLIDQGNDDEPDILGKIDNLKVIAIPHHEAFVCGPAGEVMEVSYLPKSKIDVGVSFSGEPLRIEGEVRTDNLWRNDDLPYLRPILIRKLPEEAAAAVGR